MDSCAQFRGPDDSRRDVITGRKKAAAKSPMIARGRRITAALAALGLLGALALSGCSASPSQPNADLPKSTPAAHASKKPSPSPSASSTVPTFNLPADLHVVIDADTTSNATQNAVLTDAGYQWMSYMEAISQGNASDPNFTTWTVAAAYATMSTTVNSWKSKGQRVTGTDHIFNRTVKLNSAGTVAAYGACENTGQTKALTISSNATAANGSSSYALWVDTFQLLPSGSWIMTNVVEEAGDPLCAAG